MNNKPIILVAEEFKTEITQMINKAIQQNGLPCYIIDMILTELRTQIKEGAKYEVETALQQFQQQENTQEEKE